MNDYRLDVRGERTAKRGTAWFVGPDRVVTAFHVVGERATRGWQHELDPTCEYRLLDARGELAALLSPALCDPDADVALLTATGANPPIQVRQLADELPPQEARWDAGGFPAFHGERLFALCGTIAKVHDAGSDQALQLVLDQGSLVAWDGVSGAAVHVNCRVVGVITDVTDGANTAWAAAATAVSDLHRFHGEAFLADGRTLLLDSYAGRDDLLQLWDELRLPSCNSDNVPRETVADLLVRRIAQEGAKGLYRLFMTVERHHPTSARTVELARRVRPADPKYSDSPRDAAARELLRRLADRGQVIEQVDVTPDARAAEFSGVIAGETPNLDHLRKGYFRHRPLVFSPVAAAFRQWLSRLDPSDEVIRTKLPVFWIGGRSGDGKSVLLLQLISYYLTEDSRRRMLYLRRREDLPGLLHDARVHAGRVGHALPPLLVAVDDLYDIRDRDRWDDDIRESSLLGVGPLAIITASPSEQFEICRRRLRDVLTITEFSTPHLDSDEREAFVRWYAARRGSAVAIPRADDENVLLVQLMFELAHGSGFADFAQRFKRRLQRAGVFDAARAFVAVNALYLDAPLGILPDDLAREALHRLCLEDQLHFLISGPPGVENGCGVRLAHPHLSWLLLREWLDDTTFVREWVRELMRCLDAWISEGDAVPVLGILRAIVSTTRLANCHPEGASAPHPVHLRSDVLRDLYGQHIRNHGGQPWSGALLGWVEALLHVPDLALSPSPLTLAVKELESPSRSAVVDPRLAAAVALAKYPSEADAIRAQNVASRYFEDVPPVDGTVRALSFLLTGSNHAAFASEIVKHWLALHGTRPEAFHLLSMRMSRAAADIEVTREQIIQWLRANPTDEHVHFLLSALAARSPRMPDLVTQIIDVVRKTSATTGARIVLAALVKANPGDDTVVALALEHATDWGASATADLLGSLIAANPDDPRIRDLAAAWIQYNPSDSKVPQFLTALLRANRGDRGIAKLAQNWLALERPRKHYVGVLSALIAANPRDDGIADVALNWATCSRPDQHAVTILGALLGSRPGDPRGRELALKWLDGRVEPQTAATLLSPLLRVSPGDDLVIRKALEWLDRTDAKHPFNIISALCIANPSDRRVRDRLVGWLQQNAEHAQMSDCLAAMLRAYPRDLAVVGPAIDTMFALRGQAGEVQLLVALVGAQGDDTHIRDYALKWIEKNRSHSHVQNVLIRLVSEWPDEPRVQAAAQEFMRAGAENRAVGYMLPKLLRTNGTREDFKKIAQKWLVKNATHTQAQAVVEAFVETSSDTSEVVGVITALWAQIERLPAGLVGCLAELSVQTIEDLDLVVRTTAARAGEAQRIVKAGIRRGLKCRLDLALRYLNGDADWSHKRIVFQALLFAAKFDSDVAAKVVTDVLPALNNPMVRAIRADAKRFGIDLPRARV